MFINRFALGVSQGGINITNELIFAYVSIHWSSIKNPDDTELRKTSSLLHAFFMFVWYTVFSNK